MKEISKREQKKLEKLKQENIQKFDEEYRKSRIIPRDYKKKIRSRVLKNTFIAIIIIAYIISINVLSLYMETNTYIFLLKGLCIIFAIISVVYFELSYRKDSGYLFLHGVEFLLLATTTSLFSIYAYSLYFNIYNIILSIISGIIFTYYIIKTIITIRNMKKQYYKEQNDIKEIIKKQGEKDD